MRTLKVSGDRPARIPNPLTPGAGVEPGAAETCDLQTEQIVTGGDPGSAHRRHLARFRAAQDASAIGAAVRPPAGNVRPARDSPKTDGSRHRECGRRPHRWAQRCRRSAPRLAHPPRETFGSPSRAATCAVRITASSSTCGTKRPGTKRPAGPSGATGSSPALKAPPASDPGLKATVENGCRAVSQPTQHPPQAGCKGAGAVIVGDDLRVLRRFRASSRVAAKTPGAGKGWRPESGLTGADRSWLRSA